MRRMRALKAKYAIVGDVRGKGLLLGIELVRNHKTKERASAETEQVGRQAEEGGTVGTKENRFVCFCFCFVPRFMKICSDVCPRFPYPPSCVSISECVCACGVFAYACVVCVCVAVCANVHGPPVPNRSFVSLLFFSSFLLQVMYEALSRGLSFKTTMSNIITLVPPLTITEPELDQVFDILDASIAALGNAAHLKP